MSKLRILGVAAVMVFAIFSGSIASASAIRYLLIEHVDGSGRNMEFIPQETSGNSWIDSNVGVPLTFDNYVSNFSLLQATSNAISLSFDMFGDPNNQSGAAIADVASYNYFDKVSNDLTAYLTVTQEDVNGVRGPRVTISYVSIPAGSIAFPIIGGTSIIGVPSLAEVAFESSPPDLQLCASMNCLSSLAPLTGSPGGVWPNYFALTVARVPEPSSVLLVGIALVSLLLARLSRSRYGHRLLRKS